MANTNNIDMDANAANHATGGPDIKEMRSVVLTGFGNLSKVKVYKSPQPMVGPGEVLIRVKACGVNFQDLMIRQGVADNLPNTPLIMGYEVSGYVETWGDGVEGIQVGTPVLAFTRYGAMAEYVVAPFNRCYVMPNGMSFEDGASILMNYVTAYLILLKVAGASKDKILLIHGAGGGVGCAVAQLCNHIENFTLIGTASQHKHEALRKMGLYTYLFDRYQQDYVEEVKKLSPYGVDIVLDSLGGAEVDRGISLTKPMGHYVLYGASISVVNDNEKGFLGYTKSLTQTPLNRLFQAQKVINQWWQVEKINPVKLFEDNRSIGGFNLLNLLFDQGQEQLVRETVNELFAMYAKGKIKPVIDSTWALEQAVEAMTRMQDHQNVGKVLLMIDQ